MNTVDTTKIRKFDYKHALFSRTNWAVALSLLIGLPPFLDTIIPLMPDQLAARLRSVSIFATALGVWFSRRATTKIVGVAMEEVRAGQAALAGDSDEEA